MAAAADELVLLERVFLRIGSAETDEQLQKAVSKFLPPVLLKLSSQQEGVRKKVLELLVHINKRLKARSTVQLPVEALLLQYQDPVAGTFIVNFSIIYIKLGYPRLPLERQIELIPSILNSVDSKPQFHQHQLLLLIIPVLGHVKVPLDTEQRRSLFGLNEKPHASKQLLELLLDMLLLPYGTMPPSTSTDQQNEAKSPVPPGMSSHTFKRATNDNPLRPEELEEVKLGIVKFLSQGIFADEEIIIHLIVAASDTRFNIANLADLELRKIVGNVDWSSPTVPLPLYELFLGTQSEHVAANMKKIPANTRIRLKLLLHLCRVTANGFILPATLHIIFDPLYGSNTNAKLKTLAMNFAMNFVRTAEEAQLSKAAVALQKGLQKSIREANSVHQGQVFLVLGLLGSRFPKMTFHNVTLLETFFKNLESASQELKLQVREGFLSLISAYKYDIDPEELDKNGRISILFALVNFYLFSQEPMVRFVAVRSIGIIFPPNHVPSKFLLLLATGDSKEEVSMEAFKCLYGTSRKSDVDLAKTNNTSKDVPKVVLPEFAQITKYVYVEAETRVKDATKRVNVGSHVLPFTVNVYIEVLIYLRLCLIQHLENVPLTREIVNHPTDCTPVIRERILQLYDEKQGVEKNSLLQYLSLIRQLFCANSGIEPLSCLVEVIGSVPKLSKLLQSNLQLIRDLLNSTKEDVREKASLLYGLVFNEISQDQDVDSIIIQLIIQTSSKTLEVQHGAVLGLANLLERRLVRMKNHGKDVSKWDGFRNAVNAIGPFLGHQNNLLISAACTAMGLVGKTTSLPLEDGKIVTNGSPDAKRPAKDNLTKIGIVNALLEIMNNAKIHAKVRERSAKALGLICVGEEFPYSKEVAQGLLNTAKETKDVEVHFTVGESLVMCVQSVWSAEARDAWTTSPNDFQPEGTNKSSDDILTWLLDELFKLAMQTHPNSKQASCIWLLAILKNCADREPIRNRFKLFQDTFMELLRENNDIIQDVASKGLCLVYDHSKSEELLTALVEQLTSGSRKAVQVTSDTKLFEEGQLGKAPTGGNLSTYKELCSLASDLNKPDLIYQFMHLANHNAIWNSKKGAAFGFSSIAEKCGEHLQAHLPKIVPKLYRYQYDPTPNLQASMQNIWHVLVPETQKTLDQYHHEILRDLLDNLNSAQYRVRQSCCLALQDFLKGAGNRSIHDSIDYMNELWSKLFRVMDDHHEATRITAVKTAKVLSKLCIRGCDVTQGKAGVKMVQSILPIFLNTGITNTVAEVRSVSLTTISELVGAAGEQLKPFLGLLMPALLQATGELESSKLSYLSTMLGAQSQAQEAVDSARASFAKSHFTTETVVKCLQYADSSILEELTPKITELMRSQGGLGTRIVCAHFITLLVIQLGSSLQPYTGKFLAALVNGLTDRNAAIRKHYASAIGHLVSTAKESSLDKLFAKLQTWYFEREDDSIRSACAYTIQSISNHNQEVLKNYSDVVLPLVFFAIHAEKTPDTESTLEVWNDIWSEISPGTETGIRQNIKVICDTLRSGLESPSWTMKAQAANAVSTVATKLGPSLDANHRNDLLQILLNGLGGRTWNGKDKVLKALASICTSCRDGLREDNLVDKNDLIEVVLRESRKEERVYKTSALKALGEILSVLQVDKFEEVYGIAQTILVEKTDKDEDVDLSSEEMSKKRDDILKLKEVVYETIGKAWPEGSRNTQEKYREEFVQHCLECLPKNTRNVQICVISALRDYIDKLTLLRDDQLSPKDEQSLKRIIDKIVQAIKYVLGVSKYTRLRKEVLSVVFTLGTRLKDKNRSEEFALLSSMFEEMLPEIEKDHQPEIKSRVTDIKNLFKN